MPSPAPGRTGGCWLPAAPLESRCIPAQPGGGQAALSELARNRRFATSSRSTRHGEYVAVIHRSKNALRLGTYDTGEARGKRGSGSGKRQSVSCKLLCLRGKSLPEPSRGAERRQLQAGRVFALGFPALPRVGWPPGTAPHSPSTPEYSDAHLFLSRGNWAPADTCFPQGCSIPHTLSGDMAGSQESWIHPWSLPLLPFPSQGFTLGSLEGATSGRKRCQRDQAQSHPL